MFVQFVQAGNKHRLISRNASLAQLVITPLLAPLLASLAHQAHILPPLALLLVQRAVLVAIQLQLAQLFVSIVPLEDIHRPWDNLPVELAKRGSTHPKMELLIYTPPAWIVRQDSTVAMNRELVLRVKQGSTAALSVDCR